MYMLMDIFGFLWIAILIIVPMIILANRMVAKVLKIKKPRKKEKV